MKLWKDLANAMYVPQSGVPTHRRHVLWEVGRLCNSSPICPNDSFHASRLRQVQVSYISLLTKRRQPSQAASPRQAYISAWSRGSHQRRSGCGGSRHEEDGCGEASDTQVWSESSRWGRFPWLHEPTGFQSFPRNPHQWSSTRNEMLSTKMGGKTLKSYKVSAVYFYLFFLVSFYVLSNNIKIWFKMVLK